MFSYLYRNHQFTSKQQDIVSEFDSRMSKIRFKKCCACKMVKLGVTLFTTNDGDKCKRCKDKNYTSDSFPHPSWIDSNGQKHFEQPEELTGLTEGEKLLLQQVSPYIPLHHLQKGSYGCKGHVCSFPQDIHHVCKELPRLPSDISVIRVVKQFTDDDNQVQQTSFSVRKNKVYEALRWLKQHNKEYESITICEENLDCLDGDIGNLLEEGCDTSHEQKGCKEPSFNDNAEPPGIFGYVSTNDLRNVPKPKDKDTTNILQSMFDTNNKNTSMDFPYVCQDALNEYDKTRKLFCLAFPWLFPGGIGDINDFSNVSETVDQWMERLLYYEDGRFATDKMWAFYALNYAVRKKNNDSGAYFVNGFFDNGPQTLAELQDKVMDGDMSWVNRLAYFSYHVKGSPGYWRFKRSEVYSWINHHIESKHGPPSLFITLSCAEFHWPDIKRLLEDRYLVAGISPPDLESTGFINAVNNFTLIVQEYFQLRVQNWMETVGKHIFGIQHHWLRYEFAPGRGQIHAHMLAITDHLDVFQKCHRLRGNKQQQALLLSDWARTTFGMTATIPSSTDISQDFHPSSIRFCNVLDIDQDIGHCFQHLQMHKCSNKCMKKRKHM